MLDFASMTPFEWVVFACSFIIGGAICAAMALILRTRDELTRAVVADVIFYGMICLMLVRTMMTDLSIIYDIVLLAAVVAGILPTLSMSRIISKGRR